MVPRYPIFFYRCVCRASWRIQGRCQGAPAASSLFTVGTSPPQLLNLTEPGIRGHGSCGQFEGLSSIFLEHILPAVGDFACLPGAAWAGGTGNINEWRYDGMVEIRGLHFLILCQPFQHLVRRIFSQYAIFLESKLPIVGHDT